MSKQAKNTIVSIIAIMVATVVTYLPYFKNTFGIDTSTMILNQQQMIDGYLSQGRFGIVLLFKLFIHNYDNAVVPFVVVPLLGVAGVYLYYILQKYDSKASSFRSSIFSIAFINNPIVYSQIYFKMQAIHIVVGLFCVLIGTHLFLSKAKMIAKIVIGTLLFAFSLLIYQVFAFFIFSMILLCLLIFPEKRQEILKGMLPSWILSGIIYLISYVIASLMIHYSSYGSETYVMWNKLGTVGGLQKVGALVMAVVAIAYAFLLVTTFMRYKSGKKVDRLIIFLLVLSIFTFNMAFGNVKPAPRVYFGTFSVVFASILYIWTNKKSVQLKWLSIAIALFSVVFTMSLSQKANNSYTNDAILSQNVAMFAKDNKIEKTPISKTGALFNEAGFNSNGGLNKVNANVVFLGNLQVGNQGIISKFQDIFITGATRSSFFQFDPPLTSMRPYDFMRTQGYEFKIPDQSLREKMTLQYAQLPVYPNTGSMVYDKANQTIVVKLSN